MPQIRIMKTSTLIKDKRWDLVKLSRICDKALQLALMTIEDRYLKCGISVLACNDAEIAKLNLKFRGKDSPTNILSWPEYDLRNNQPGQLPQAVANISDKKNAGILLGNLALSFDTCFNEAKNSSLNFTDYLTHLCLHGCLHLLGFDHEKEKDARLMEKTEVNLLSSVGIKNPYERDEYR